MATKSRAQLVNEALAKLGVIAAGQSAEADDFDVVDGKIESLVDQLSMDDICEVNPEEIEAALFEAVASLLANISGQPFGVPYNDAVKTTFERQLIRLTAERPTRETLVADYF